MKIIRQLFKSDGSLLLTVEFTNRNLDQINWDEVKDTYKIRDDADPTIIVDELAWGDIVTQAIAQQSVSMWAKFKGFFGF